MVFRHGTSLCKSTAATRSSAVTSWTTMYEGALEVLRPSSVCMQAGCGPGNHCKHAGLCSAAWEPCMHRPGIRRPGVCKDPAVLLQLGMPHGCCLPVCQLAPACGLFSCSYGQYDMAVEGWLQKFRKMCTQRID